MTTIFSSPGSILQEQEPQLQSLLERCTTVLIRIVARYEKQHTFSYAWLK
jgi:hypothetical protein